MNPLLMILNVLVLIDIVTILFIIVIERKDPNKACSWISITLFMPFIGAIGYFVIGQRIILPCLYSKKREADRDTFSAYDGEDFPFLEGNMGSLVSSCENTEFFSDGMKMFTRLKEDLQSAEKSILAEFYIMRDDELSDAFLDILRKKASDGIDVKLIGDGFGFRFVPEEKIQRLRDCGGKVVFVHRLKHPSLNPIMNNCDHRKIVVIDGKIAYCGGFNLCNDYVGMGHLGYWRDSAVRTTGDSAVSAAKGFATMWRYAEGEVFDIPDYSMKGNDRIACIFGGPENRRNPILEQYLKMLDSAEDTVYLHTPYLHNRELIQALRRTAERGVSVYLILPGHGDHWFTYWNNARCAKMVMKSGVRISMYCGGFMHSKTIVVDGRYCSVGSGNFDDRTAYYNFDANFVFDSKKMAEMMMETFEEDLQQCTDFDIGKHSGFVPFIKKCIAGIVRNLS